LAQVRANDYVAARTEWARALALSPAGASYRRDIAMRLMLLDRLLEQQAG
jgi:Flp pilus assembly protein TadD